MLTRRSLLGRAALGGVAVLTPGLAFAGPRGGVHGSAADGGGRRFVFVILRGAMDGVATVMPVGDPAYAGLRGALAEPADAAPLKLDATFALHPAMAATAAMYARGEALFVHAVASPYRERSHFEAQNVLETGGTAAYALKDGWLNRLVAMLPRDPAMAIAATVPMALRGTAPVSSYAPSALPQATDDLTARVAALYAGDPQLHALWTAAVDAQALAAGSAPGGKASPAALGRLAATFLARADGPRIATIEIGGWDTHAGQAGRLAGQLRQLDATLAALQAGLGPAWSDTIVLAATEFGRTAAINGTGGTDHGTGGAAIVAGGAVRGGRVVADWPGLAPGQLFENRDLRPTTDLRGVMLGLAAEGFGLDPARVSARLFPEGGVRPIAGLVRA